MIRAEFGIIEQIDFHKDYSDYTPQKYDCISIDDNVYITDWWNELVLLKTYFHCMSNPAFALARWGVTIIPPQSLPTKLIYIIFRKTFSVKSKYELPVIHSTSCL